MAEEDGSEAEEAVEDDEDVTEEEETTEAESSPEMDTKVEAEQYIQIINPEVVELSTEVSVDEDGSQEE